MKLIIASLGLAVLLSGCFPKTDNTKPVGYSSGYPIIIYQGGARVAMCDRIDEEKRIAYNCYLPLTYSQVSEYHLGQTDGWGKQ